VSGSDKTPDYRASQEGKRSIKGKEIAILYRWVKSEKEKGRRATKGQIVTSKKREVPRY